MSIYKSTLNTSKQRKREKQKTEKIKVKKPAVISKKRFSLIILLLVSVVGFLCLCLPSNFVKNFLLGVLGLSAYPICVLSAFLCSMSLGKTKYEVNKKYTIYLTCALFFVMMVVHLILTTKLELNSFGQYLSDTYALKTSGAGWVMSLVTYWMKKYLTVVGAYIFAVILLTVFIGLILDIKNGENKPKVEQQEKKSEFNFGSFLEEPKAEEVPVTLKYKQEDVKKKIAKQKLGLEAGSSTIISSSMRLEDIPDTPERYKSKREYILTPPEIVIPSYEAQKQPEKRDIASKVNVSSDIFVSNTDDFYKDAKVIEGKDIDINKIQQAEPKFTNAQAEFKPDNIQEESKPVNIFDALQPNDIQSIKPMGFDTQSVNSFVKQDENPQEKTFEENFEEIKPYNEYSDEINEEFDDIDEEFEEADPVAVPEPIKPTPQFELPKTHTAEVVHSASFDTQPKVFTREVAEEKHEELGRPKKAHAEYIKPPADLLEYIVNTDVVSDEECQENIEKLERVLEDFKINAKVKAVQVGPAVTRYEIGMPQGVSVKKVQFHADDIAMALASNGSIRIEAPIPGKNAVGIEVPNRTIMGVSLREMVESLDFQKRINPMSFVLGKDINGSIQFCNLDKMPHLLVAGSTGSGKSVCLNTMLISMLYKSSPEDVRLILIDPKTVEFSTYANLPHLLTPNIITTKEQTINALNWAIKEMEYRYGLLQRNQVVNIKEYNSLDIVKNGEVEKLPYIVIVIDELGDLMIEAKREMEERIMKLAQKSRAAGIHLVIATQRPSVDVITGTIKANLPSRVAFALTNFADSKTVLDMGGAEKLLGKGDMLFKPSDLPEPRRVQGAFISSKEVAAVVKFIKENNRADFDEDAQKDINQSAEVVAQNVAGDNVSFDPVLKDALRFFIQANQASITMIQRRFGVGYARAARIIDQMEQNGFISPADGSKPRQVLISLEEYNLLFNG